MVGLRDISTPVPELVPVFAQIYANTDEHWAAYETCEELVDLDGRRIDKVLVSRIN